ncbi:stealth family protein [Yersinia intermedia]|uniref:stealth family protein n=1 Tax=Yersinia intermedia TaxID=631 RepID=UPI0005E9A43D|nr:stealth family protein [Yersinia intermedia]CNB36061.1 Capsular polysaccharide phosphotransferase SacB [Yersinia intermedia]CRE60792.1 Capsular polysaccharide phosphotransferase SacB [Yersinia intermedia]
MSKLIRKSKKFFKSPYLFIKDMRLFNKTKNNNTEEIKKTEEKMVTNVITKPKSAPEKKNKVALQNKPETVKISSLIEDFLTPHEQEHIIYKLLDKAGINYHTVSVPWSHIIRIAVQDSFINTVVSLISESNEFTKKVYIAKPVSRFDLVKIYFHDEKFIFKKILIQFDPWYITPTGIMTRNSNNLIQFIPKAHINKSVHSFAPIRLGRNTNDIDDINSMVGLDSFMFEEYQSPIDIVFTWVSDSDPNWIRNKNSYSGVNASESDTRFIDYEQLRYSLRSVAYYAKFIRNIYIVTDNQVPYWIDTNHDKIKIINHSEIFEDTSVLPVFNSVAIESWIHRIPGLSENFIYANDDYFFGSPVTKSHFIHPNGVAKLFLESVPNAFGEIFEDSEPTTQLSLFTAQCFYEKFGHWPSFWPLHAPMIKNIHVIEKMISEFYELTIKTSSSRFREIGTISPLYLMSSYYAYEKGNSVVSKIRYEYVSTDDIALDTKLTNLLIKIKANTCDVFCLNDHRTVSDNQIKKVVNFMKEAFPIAAEWEIDNKIHL